MVCLGLPVSHYMPAGIRVGGATREYLQRTTVERLMWHGRWEAHATLKHYIQESASVLAVASLPSDVMARVAALGEAFADVILAL